MSDAAPPAAPSGGFTAKIEVFLKPGVLDVQGKAIEQALHGLGFPGASEVRVGRMITLALAAPDRAAAEAQVKAMCDRLLANAVIERYTAEVAEERRQWPTFQPS